MANTHSAVPAPQETAPNWSARRADARRNHDRIVTAALQVFAERGLEATVPDVAARAGVGKATVYRSYPTKADLVLAVAQYHMQWLEQRSIAALTEPDAHTALRDLLRDAFERFANDRVLAEVLPQNEAVGVGGEALERTLALWEQLLRAAKAQGRIRADASVLDLRVLLGGCARQLVLLGEHDPAVWRRYGDLTINALRPPAG